MNIPPGGGVRRRHPAVMCAARMACCSGVGLSPENRPAKAESQKKHVRIRVHGKRKSAIGILCFQWGNVHLTVALSPGRGGAENVTVEAGRQAAVRGSEISV
jgi:hypothetical protein